MNCYEIDKLLPLYVDLYVAGDINGDVADVRRQQLVLRHLRSCAACRAQAEEYRTSQAWLCSQPPPQFSEDFFVEVRGRVLRDINHCSPQPLFVQVISSFFNRKLVYASSVALLIAIFAALVHYMQNDQTRRAFTPNNTLAKRASVMKQILEPSRAESQANNSARPATEIEHRIAHRHRRDSARVNTRTLKTFDDVAVKSASVAAGVELETGAQEQDSLIQSSPLTSEIDASSEIASSAVPDELFGQALEAAATDDAANDQAVTRIEIQTSDPNIRIIWLAPKITE